MSVLQQPLQRTDSHNLRMVMIPAALILCTLSFASANFLPPAPYGGYLDGSCYDVCTRTRSANYCKCACRGECKIVGFDGSCMDDCTKTRSSNECWCLCRGRCRDVGYSGYPPPPPYPYGGR